MYIPEHFAMTDRVVCHETIRSNGFGDLVSLDADGQPLVSHIPFWLDGERGANGTLVGHLAAGNPQVRSLSSGRAVLAVFHGPHAYVSPGWYAVQPAVPTWNYVVVHARGIPRLVLEPMAVREGLERLVTANEAVAGSGWKIDRLPDDYLAEMIRQIVMFEVPIDQLEGKAKLSQNRSAEDRAGVIAALERSGDPSARAVASAMKSSSSRFDR